MSVLAGRGLGTLARAVHIRLSPAPANLSESSEVLKVLQGYGDVVMFRNLRYDTQCKPSSMVAMFRSEESAQKLLNESPVYFTLDPLPSDQITKPIGGLQEETRLREAQRQQCFDRIKGDNDDNNNADEMIRAGTLLHTRDQLRDQQQLHSSEGGNIVSSSAERLNAGQVQRNFRVLVDVSNLSHAEEVYKQPYSGNFTVRPNLIQEDLAQTTPMRGLSEISFTTLRFTRLREKEREQTKHIKSLGQLWEDGLSEQKSDEAEDGRSQVEQSNTGLGVSENTEAGERGLGASIQRAVDDVSKMLAGDQEPEERKRRYYR